MTRRSISSNSVLALLLLGTAPAAAQQPAPAATPVAPTASDVMKLLPISIDWDQSDMVREDGKTKMLLKGNVMARQGEVAVRADRVEATYLNTPRQISHIVAEGEVTVTWGTKMGRADRAEFDNVARTIRLVGAPTVVEEWGILAAREITLFIDDGRVECDHCSIDLDPSRIQEMTEDARRSATPPSP